MMKKLVLAAALLALAVPVHAQNAAPTNQPNAQQGSVSAATKKFMDDAAITDMFEIRAGQQAQQKSVNSAYKDFAQMTIDDHTKIDEQLKSMAPKLGAQLPLDLDATPKGKIDKLNSLSGAAFERQYKTDQVQGHRQAIAEFEGYSKNGDNADLRKWADDTLPILKKHLQHAEALRPTQAPTTGSGTRR
jgi:putative membrane protein